MFRIKIDTLVPWASLTFAAIFCVYVFSPLHSDPTATWIVRIAFLPVVMLAASAIWEQFCLHLMTRSATLVSGKARHA